MKFKVEKKEVEVHVNGEKQNKKIKKAKLSDKGLKLNDVMKKFLSEKKKEDKNE